MYSFESSNDFEHKIGYVSSYCVTADSGSSGAPIEPVYMFDDLFERFRSEIDYAIASGTAFQSNPLKLARLRTNDAVSSTYYFFRLNVTANGSIRIFQTTSTSLNPTFPSGSYAECTKEQYQTGDPVYSNIGKIFLLSQCGGDPTQPATISTGFERVVVLGPVSVQIGTWNPNYGSYGRMEYSYTGERVYPSQIPLMTVSQLGYPTTDSSEREKQPEIIAYFSGTRVGNPSDKKYFASIDGEIDPDPDPPGPTPPGPGGDDPNDRDPEPSDKESTGGGPHTPHNDPLPIPGLPTVGAVSGGAFNVFKLTANEFNAFNGELYSDNAWTALKNYFNDPLDFMIGCIMVPAIAQSLGVLHPKFNSYVWSQAYARVIEQYVELNCGSIVCRAYYGSCFDYSPYTKVQLFLPFIGYVDLDPDEIMDMAVSIKYHIDVCTGDCVAFVSSALVSENARVIGQYNGNCGTQIPITRSNYDNVIAAGMNLLAASASAVGTYRAGGAAIGAASLTGASDAAIAGREIGLNAHLSSQLGAATMSAMAGSKSSVSRNGTLGGTCGLMGMLKPHLLVHTPRQSKPSNYMEMRGYPSNIGGVVGDFEGYLEVMDVRLNNIPATIDEINEIYELLKGGIII